jgi:hypothetical protein
MPSQPIRENGHKIPNNPVCLFSRVSFTSKEMGVEKQNKSEEGEHEKIKEKIKGKTFESDVLVLAEGTCA